MPVILFILKKCSKKIVKLSNTYERVQSCSVSNVSDYPVPDLTPVFIKNKLLNANLKFTVGYTSFVLPECAMCVPFKKPVASRSADSFINKQTGFFTCELCKCAGPWEVFEKLLSKSKISDKSAKEVMGLRDGLNTYCEKEQQSWKKIESENISLCSLTEEEYAKVFMLFNLREVPKSTLGKLNIYLSTDHQTLYFPLILNQQILGHIHFDAVKGQSSVPKRNCAGFLLLSPKRKHSSAVIVSNLQDFFALASSNLTINLICLPHGVSNIPQIALPFFEQYESLTLWLGTVNGAYDAARNFAKKLNEKRCYIVQSTESQASPLIAVENNQNIRKIISEAQPTWHQAITTFASLRSDVLLELQNHEQVLGVKWKRFPVLNKTLKGLRRGELTVLTGPTGAGKTTLMAEYSLDLAIQGVNTLWGSFEVRNVRLARTMLQQFVGQPLEDQIVNFDVWADKFEQLPLYYLTFHGQQSIKNVMDAVQHAAYIYDIAHVIIDNVQFMIGMSEDSKYQDRFHKQDLIIHAFRTFATRSNVHVTLVIHPRKEKESDDLTASSIFGGAKAAQEADNVLIIQDKRLTSVKGKKYLQVAKNRYTGDLGIMPLEFDKESLSFRTKRKVLSEEKPSIQFQPAPTP